MTEAFPARLGQLASDEQELVRRIAAGDRDAFELLMRRYNRRLYRVARVTIGNDAEAEDVLQEAYLLAYRRIGQFRGDASLFTWLSRLVLNECFGRMRKEARRHKLIPMVDMNESVEVEMDARAANEPDLPEKAAARAEVRAILERKLDVLPEAFRTVFVLRSVEELSIEETAQCLGLPEATVRSRHSRARSMLRESLGREFDDAERDLFEFGGAHCDRTVMKVLTRLADEGEQRGQV
ncbi:MAG TPA: RNA polymerase sigma factor [Paraburkholderia sp.]